MTIRGDMSNDALQLDKALGTLNNAAEECRLTMTSNRSDSVECHSAVHGARQKLIVETLKFLQIVQGPVDTVQSWFDKTAHIAAIRSLLEMGVFDKLPAGGAPRTAEELAQDLNVEQDLVARLMRITSIYGPFEEVGPSTYRHTLFSEVYLRPEVRGLFRFVMDEHMPTHLRMHDFLAYNGWKSPDSVSNNPYTYTHNTGGKSMFQHLASYPGRMEAFSKGMTMQAMTSAWMLDVYPFKQVVSEQRPTSNDPVAVDIGGGKGRAICQIRSLCGDLPGRYILQDQEHVIRSIVPPPDGIEMVPHDFFTEQPVKGALIYLIRRCLHNWPPSKVREILKKIVAAMEVNKSRLLIEEILVPPTRAGIEEGWMDILMMSLGGKQRTIEEWRTVMADVGLRMGKVYQIPGSCNGIIEAWRA
ncbi:S-adenosyl-L-methionine-dependent methyltransferase [Aspergillus floccosus]